MFKKVCMAGLLAFSAFIAKAQVDFSAINFDLGGNYTRYMGDFQQSAKAIKIKVSVPFNEKFRLGIGYTHALKIKIPSTVSLYSGNELNSEIVYNFKTYSLNCNYFFNEQEDEGLNAYLLGGASLVMVTGKENVLQPVPTGDGISNLAVIESVNGFSIHGGIGAEYSFGIPKVFAEAEFALPANRVNNVEVSNPIPAHLMFNVGFRFGLGSGSFD
ncbi:MAG: hypothetical protein RLY16_422 [Bacteroidota bacterium]